MQHTKEFICKRLGVAALSMMVLACLNYEIKDTAETSDSIDSVLCLNRCHIFSSISSLSILINFTGNKIKCGGAVMSLFHGSAVNKTIKRLSEQSCLYFK